MINMLAISLANPETIEFSHLLTLILKVDHSNAS